jgi:hypothetical protein
MRLIGPNPIKGIVSSTSIDADAITGAKIADDALDSEHYADGSIDTAHLAADAVTGAKIADDALDSEHYTDGSIDTAHLAADAVTGAKIADNAIDSEHYTDASIDNAHLADDAVGVAELSATGTASSGTFLRGDNSWAAAGGGSWNIIGTAVASGSASLDITGLSSTYDTYCIAGSDLVPATDNVRPYIRMGDSGGFDSGASDYFWLYYGNTEGAGASSSPSTQGGSDNADAQIDIGGQDNTGSAAGEGQGFIAYLHRPGDGTTRPGISGHGVWSRTDGYSGGRVFYGTRKSVITLDRIQFFFSSGNVATGRLTVWGIAHA